MEKGQRRVKIGHRSSLNGERSKKMGHWFETLGSVLTGDEQLT